MSEAVVPTVTEAADAVASTGPFESVDQVIETLREQGNVGVALGGSEAITQTGLDAEEETGADTETGEGE